jgi:sugar phosphate isomerase/epimerase
MTDHEPASGSVPAGTDPDARPPGTTIGICLATLLRDPMTAGPDEVRAAAEAVRDAGVTGVSVWAHQLGWLPPLADLGLRLCALEAAMSWSGGPTADAVAEAETMVATAVAHGASKLVAVCLDPALDPSAARDGLTALVERAASAGVQVCVEFLPWSGIPDLATAWGLVEPLGPSAGILLDSWHWQRQPGGPNPELLATIAGERIGYVQLCDAAPGDARDMDEAMNGRLLPGDGVVDFASLAEQLAAIGADPVVATEVFNPRLVADRGVAGLARAFVGTAELAFTLP